MATTTTHPQRQDSAYDTKEKDSIEQIERHPQHPEIIVDEKVHDPGLCLHAYSALRNAYIFRCRCSLRGCKDRWKARPVVSSIVHDLCLCSHGLLVLHGKWIRWIVSTIPMHYLLLRRAGRSNIILQTDDSNQCYGVLPEAVQQWTSRQQDWNHLLNLYSRPNGWVIVCRHAHPNLLH